MGAHTLPEDMSKANDRFGSVDDGKALTFSGDLTFSGANAHTGVETHTGAETHSGAEVFTTQPKVVTEGTAGNRGPSPLIWDDCNVLDFMINPTNGFVYFNDFIDGGYTLAAAQTVTHLNEGVCGFTGATSGSTIDTEKDEPTGALTLSSTTINEGAGINILGGVNDAAQVIFNTSSTEQVWFEARIKSLNITNAKFGIFCGFAEEGLASEGGVIGTDDILTDKDYVGFHKLAADGDTLDTVFNTASGGTSPVTIKPDAVTLEADTYIKIGFHFDGTTVTFYANGVALADTIAKTATDFPDGQEMCFYFVAMNAHGDPAESTIDWVRIAREF